MTQRSTKRPLIVLLLLVTPISARAQRIPAACQPLIDAERKMFATPNHAYQSMGTGQPGSKQQTLELITVGGASYFETDGKWMRSPVDPKAALDELNKNVATAAELTCARAGDESVGGAAATIYTSHATNEGVTADMRAWVARSTGLILRIEEDVGTGAGDKQHISIRYDYSNVRAPAGAQ